MRCKNCGWENPNGLNKCEKCHSQLTMNGLEDKPTNQVSERMKSTVAENVIFEDKAQNPVPITCPQCGYPVSNHFSYCPNCNHKLTEKNEKQGAICKSCGAHISVDAKYCSACGTPTSKESPVHPHIERTGLGTRMGGPSAFAKAANTFCTLKPIPWEGERVNYNPITFSGDVIVLNRSNTDANNNTITSREQAVLTYENGSWFIENKSELKTTYIRINGRVKLNDGDIIILGNREFEFNG